MQNTETSNLIYFQQKPLKANFPQQLAQNSSKITQFSQAQANERNRINEQYEVFQRIYDLISQSSAKDEEGVDRLCKGISDYIIYLVKYQNDQTFFTRAVEGKFIALLLKKMEQYKFASEVVKIVFSSLEYLLRAITNDEQQVYLVMSINKEGYLTAQYRFEEDDKPYFVNFLKILVRKINQDSKYLNVFFNLKQPQFPLLFNLLRFHDEKDQILRTSVELTLIEICSNPSKSIQKYISNFPFILFYPIYVYRIYHSFIQAISQDQATRQQGIQTLKNTLKFMEDFIQNKDRQAIEMYANCFMTLLGRYFYKELTQLNTKNEQKVTRMLGIFYEIVLKDISVLKIKIGWGQMLSKKMGKQLNKFLKSKTHHMQFNYWISDCCKYDIHEHCKSIFPYEQEHKKKSPRSSFIKTFNSYIPHTKDNWLFHEVKKISQLIGFEIELNQQINSEEYYNGSYLQAIESGGKVEQIQNQVFEKVLKYDSEEILFYYIRLIGELNMTMENQSIIQQESPETIIELLKIVNKTTSLSVVRSFYQLVLDNEIYINQIKNPKVKFLYETVMQKLIYFVLTQGWGSFWNRTKISLNSHSHEKFASDIFRDLECDILFFVALRHILGTKNSDGISDDQEFLNRDVRRVEIKSNCMLLQEREDNTFAQERIQIVLDGQYIKLLDNEQKSITHENILINRSFIHESQGRNTFEIVLKQNIEAPCQQYYLIEFLETPIKNYIWKEIKFRKDITMDLELKLRLMKFQFDIDQFKQ